MSSPDIAIRLAENTVLIYGPVRFVLNDASTLMLDGRKLAKPYSGTVTETPEGNQYALLLTDPVLKGREIFSSLTVSTPGTRDWTFGDLTIQQDMDSVFSRWPVELRQRMFNYLLGEVVTHPVLAKSKLASRFCQHLFSGLDIPHVTLRFGAWLAPHILYLEAAVQGAWAEEDAPLLLMSDRGVMKVEARSFQIATSEFATIAVCDSNVCPETYTPWHVGLLNTHLPIEADGIIADKAFGLEFVRHLESKPDYQKHLIRENVCRAVRERSGKKFVESARHLLQKLQWFLTVPPVSFVDPSLPFNLFFEHVIPVDSEGLFVSGWIRDPYNMLEEITAISALGFSFPVAQHLFRVKRADVQQEYRQSPYGNFEEDQGFFAYAPLPSAIRKELGTLGELYSFRFRITLKGGITLDITPPQHQRDAVAARNFIMKSLSSEVVSDAMLEQCLGPAAEQFQKLCMEEVAVKDVVTFGEITKKPLVSLVIPLYKRIDFVRIQFATMANDPAIRDCELIYVLDSPEQEAEVRQLLGELNLLYQLPSTLVVMKRNAGYAMATNTGTEYARGKYLVLMNSDVFPKTSGWTKSMAEFYAGSKHIGALAPKLVYEDQSLQHAGMYFAKTTFPFYINLHYFKGYPADYAEAAISRPVPAVTGACLMIDRALYEKLGRMATDYVIGDFEDSDLCMKCSAMGLTNWYFADAELYHLERQSVPLHAGYTGGLAWRYNARLHMARWGVQIESIMHRFDEPKAVESAKTKREGAA